LKRLVESYLCMIWEPLDLVGRHDTTAITLAVWESIGIPRYLGMYLAI
jgi:hypothetical protein